MFLVGSSTEEVAVGFGVEILRASSSDALRMTRHGPSGDTGTKGEWQGMASREGVHGRKARHEKEVERNEDDGVRVRRHATRGAKQVRIE